MNKENNQERLKTENLFSFCIKAWAPPEDLTVDEWADKYRMLDSSTSAEPGPWRTDRVPYMRAPMRAFTDPDVEEITFVSPSQVGKSELELNIIGYAIDQDPSTILYLQPKEKDAEIYSKTRVTPMIESTPRLKAKVRDLKAKGRSASKTILHKNFPGGSLRLVGTHSASDLSSTPVRYIIADEIDRFAESAGRDGDPWELAKRRQNTFFNRKRVAVSTPTIKDASQIEYLFYRGTQEHWKTQCPHCKEYSVIKFEDVRYKTDCQRIAGKDIWAATVLGWRCPQCLTLVDEQTAKQSPSRWEADNPDAIKTNKARSFWLTGFASPWRAWADIIQAFLEVQHIPDKLKVWKNTDLGQLWEERSLNMEEKTLIERCEEYPEKADLPEGVLCLTMSVDWQKSYMQYEIVGWGRYWESWGIRTGEIKGSPDSNEPWEEFDSIVSRLYYFENGKALNISLCFVDSGDGKVTHEVARRCADREHMRVFAVKGSSIFDKDFVNPPNHRPIAADEEEKYWLYNIGVSAGKSIVYSSLRVKEHGPKYMHFPKDESRGYTFSYFSQLISETLTKDGSKHKWVIRPGHERNEALDIRNYNRAAIQVVNPDFDAIEKYLKADPKEQKTPQPRKKKRRREADDFLD